MKLWICGVLRVLDYLNDVVATNQGRQFKGIKARIVQSVALTSPGNKRLDDINMAFVYGPKQRKIAFQ